MNAAMPMNCGDSDEDSLIDRVAALLKNGTQLFLEYDEMWNTTVIRAKKGTRNCMVRIPTGRCVPEKDRDDSIMRVLERMVYEVDQTMLKS